VRAAVSPASVALAAIVVAGAVLRFRHNDHGLPYVYNQDEGSHFTSRAVEMFGGDPNPGYFQNPSGFTYLVHAALRLRFGEGWPFGSFDAVVEQFRFDPTAIYVTARGLAALLCVVAIVVAFGVGRRLWGSREGLVAAGVLAFAFLPVFYSRLALGDVGALAPVLVALYGAVRIAERGRARDYVLAGAAAGLAIGFKYTAGLVLLPVAVAVLLRARREPVALARGAGAALLAAACLLLTTPFLVLDASTAERQILAQAELAGEVEKLGQQGESGFAYYLDSLTWGLGWVLAAAAAVGALLTARREPARAVLLALFPLALFAYLATQERFFGRWLLPAYPALALFAAAGLVRLADALRAPAAVKAAALAGLCVLAFAQPVSAGVRTSSVLGRTDTRAEAREFLEENFPRRLRAVIEPAVPARWFRLETRRRSLALARRKQFVRGFTRDVRATRRDYAATLEPATLDAYRASGFCVVVTMSTVRGRAERDGDRDALAYYDRLERESELLFTSTPYRPGHEPVPFHFDLSYNYYPPAFERPGPEVRVHRLEDCRQGFGPVPAGTGTPTDEA